MVQGNPQQQEEARDITHTAESDAPPSKPRREAGPNVRVVTRSEAAAVTPLPAKPAVPVTREALNNAIRSNNLKTIRHLLKTGQIDLDGFDAVHDLPLAVAARCGNSDAVRLLLQADANVNAGDKWDSKALALAVAEGHADVFACLYEYGADIDSEDSIGKTLLMHAAGGGSKAIVQKLLSLKANVNVVDKSGMTALMYAAQYRQLDILALLLKHGAKVNLRGIQVKM